MARFFSRSRSILKYLARLNQQKSFTERLNESTAVARKSDEDEDKKRDFGLFTKEEDVKIRDSATVTTLVSSLSSGGVTSKNAIINLASSGLTAGDASIVFIDSNTAKYYISNGEGWYNATFANADPQWDSAPNSSYTLDSTNPLSIEPIAIDSGGKILSYTATLDDDASQFLTITKDSDNGRIFTLVGESAGAVSASNSGIVTFRASDGISFVTQNSTINLIYQSTGTLTSSAASVNEGSSVTFTLPTTGYSDGTTFPYTITGIQSGDISQSLTGNMTVASDNATVTISAVADVTAEGAQTMTFSADGQSVNVTINDTSTGPQAKASGGTITYDGNFVVHTFTTNGTFNPFQALSCSYIAVGGGGHGGGFRGGSYALGSGGGGAGGYKQGGLTISSSMPITIGAGGTYTSGGTPQNGGNTTVGGQLNITATGGGAGGSVTIWNGSGGGYSGGSGGGGAGAYTANGGRGSGSSGEGNDGGIGYNFSNNSYSGGGGGGSASAGSNNSGRDGGDGGNGIASNISGSWVTYAAGGGGGSLIEQNPPSPVSNAENYRGQGGTSALGGIGGGEGGVAQYNSFGGAVGYSQHGTNGQTPGSGGGGCGRLGPTTSAADQTSLPGNGSNGIVIIRYSGV